MIWALVTRLPVAGIGGDERASQVSGEPPYIHAMLLDPDGISTPVHYGASMLPSAKSDGVGSRDDVSLRGSITRPAHSLCTLHVLGHPGPRNTRFRLLASLCRVGLATHRVPTKGFDLRQPPLPNLPGAPDPETASALRRTLSFRLRQAATDAQEPHAFNSDRIRPVPPKTEDPASY